MDAIEKVILKNAFRNSKLLKELKHDRYGYECHPCCKAYTYDKIRSNELKEAKKQLALEQENEE